MPKSTGDVLTKNILRLLMEGYDIQDVADELGCSVSEISAYISSLERSEGFVPEKSVPYHEFTENEVERFCNACITEAGKAEDIKKKTKMSLERVYSALDYIASKKPPRCRTSVHPILSAWMRHHCVSVSDFVSILNEDPSEPHITVKQMTSAISSRKSLPEPLISKISAFTGLTKNEINELEKNDSDSIEKKVLLLRMDGYSIRNASELAGCCYQTVANYLKGIETSGKYTTKDISPYHGFTQEEIEKFVDACLKTSGNAERIALITGMTMEKVYLGLDYLVSRKPMPCRDSVYPRVADWMRRHCITLNEFAKQVNIPQAKMRDVMYGAEHMSMDMAKSIAEFTGLSMKDIFVEQVPANKRKGGTKIKREDDIAPDSAEAEYSCVREDLPPADEPPIIGSLPVKRSEYVKPPVKKKISVVEDVPKEDE